jgi:membrane protease YdiL (CAAX protease family)
MSDLTTMTAYKGDTPPKPRPGYYDVIRAFVYTGLLTVTANFVLTFIVGFCYAIASAGHQKPSAEVTYLIGLAVTPAVLLYATYRRTGLDAARLGLTPIRRKWLLAILSIVVLVHLPILLWAIKTWAIRVPVLTNVRIVALGNPWLEVPMLALTIAVVPVAEELLFRGWLWSDLCKYWSYLGTMLFTGASFWLMHGLEDRFKLLGVATLVIVLTVARRYCDSTKATLFLHVLNNAYAIAYLFMMIVARRH